MIPDGYNTLDPFRKLLLIRSWCPDRTLAQARHYIVESMGMKVSNQVLRSCIPFLNFCYMFFSFSFQFAEAQVLNLEALWEESDNRTPMICFLSMGSDPTESIEKLAKKHGLVCKAISMGQGQEIHARKLLSTAMAEGKNSLSMLKPLKPSLIP